MAETRDERAERLLRLGLDLAARIRDEDPVRVRASLDPLNRDELADALTLLAACVPVEMPRSVLLGWWQHPPQQLAPCGTRSAARRHRERGEDPDPLCEFVERESDRVRKREGRPAA